MGFKMRVFLIILVMAVLIAIGYWWMEATTGRVGAEKKQEWRLRDHLYGLSFADDKTGWAVGQYGTILKSTDGGLTWKYQRSGLQEHLNSIFALTTQEAFAVGTAGTLIHTTDGGQTWKMILTGLSCKLSDIQFVSPTEGWIVGEFEYILHTKDSGRTWMPVHGGEPEPIDFTTIGDDEILDDDFGIEEEVYTLNSIYFINPQKGWTVGEAGLILHTTDGGETWKKQNSGVGTVLMDLDFFSEDIGFAVGTGNTILRTTDGGNTWTRERPSRNTNYYGVAFRRWGPVITNQDAVAVGQGVICVYAYMRNPALQNWMPAVEMRHNIDYNWIYRVKFISRTVQEAIAVGENGIILRSPSGGHEWDMINYPPKPYDIVLNP